jgi:hypothetical protein
MQERGKLIREVLPREFSALSESFKRTLGEFGKDFAIDASDGIGRKTEAPWVRLFSRSMAPTARDGFYVVVILQRTDRPFI